MCNWAAVARIVATKPLRALCRFIVHEQAQRTHLPLRFSVVGCSASWLAFLCTTGRTFGSRHSLSKRMKQYFFVVALAAAGSHDVASENHVGAFRCSQQGVDVHCACVRFLDVLLCGYLYMY